MPHPQPALIVLGLLALLFGLLGFNAYRQNRVVTGELAQSRVQVFQATNTIAAQQTEIDALDTALGEARTRLTVTEARHVELGRELSQARAQLVALDAAQQPLRTDNARLTTELAHANSQTAAMLAAFERTMAELERLMAEPVRPEPASGPVLPLLTTHRSRNAQVVSVGPSSAFIVINYGAAHGALPRQEMQILRGTESVARVHISDVREQHSIAQVLPDSLSGVLHKGDSAVLSPPSP
jgi:hypothetical protein